MKAETENDRPVLGKTENDRPVLGKTENDRPVLGKTENDRPVLNKSFGLEEGTCYLVRGKKAETSYMLFQAIVEQGTPGLCITTRFPEKVRSRYRFASVPVWWISFVPGDQHYAPNAIVLFTVDPECFKLSEFARLERSLESIDEPQLRQALDNPEHYPRTGIR